MNPERWAKIEELFHRAAESDPQHRTAVLDQACGDDSELREQVEALLSSDHSARSKMQAAVRSEFESVAFSLIGKTVSHYRILGGVGGGGMGLVYRAEDIKLGRRVAIKFLPEESAKDPAALQRFEREARSASALEHPNICPIYEFGEHEGQPFLVMQLLEGQTLRELIASAEPGKPPFGIHKLIDIAIQISAGLHAAHTQGIIHRDIKPANIFVTQDGKVKILDFGLAKLTRTNTEPNEGEENASALPADLFLSRLGIAMGTAAYMSPEQIRGEKLDARTDIFSFGLVLYEMAVGQRAFPEKTGAEVQAAILNQTPTPVRELNPGISSKLEQVINKTLEKDRTARYQTASAMEADLEGLQRQLAPKRLPRAWAVALGVAAAVIVASFVAVLMKKPKTISVAPEIKMRRLTTNSSENPVASGAISPSGKYLGYIDTRGLHLKFIDTGETRTIPKSEVVKDQSMQWEVGPWFPDSTGLLINVFASREQWNEPGPVISSIWGVSAPGGVPTKLRDHAFAWSISPDGSLVSFGTGKRKLGLREFWLMGPDGENARKVQEIDESSAIGGFGWSPDGKRYVYGLTDSSGDTLFSRDTRGGPPVTLFRPSEMAGTTDFAWLHDGRAVYSLRDPGNTVSDVCNYWTMRIDLATGRHLEEPRRLTNWPNFCVSSGSVTNNDKRLAFVAWSGFYTTYIADLEAGGKRLRNIRHFTLEDSDDQALGWTPDGRLIVAQNQGSSWRVYKQSLDSDTQEPISSSANGDWLLQGATSPDGKWYIATDWPAGESVEHPSVPFPILRIPLAGGAPETILRLPRQANVSCARPPSNTCVLAEQSEDRKQMIVSILDPVKGRGPELTRFDFDRELIEVWTCVISLDGKRLAIRRGPESSIEIHSLHGQLIRKIPSQSVGELTLLTWSADQKGFFARRKGPGGNELLHLDFQGNVTSLRKCVDPQACSGYPSPDGRHLAIIDKDQSSNMWMMEDF